MNATYDSLVSGSGSQPTWAAGSVLTLADLAASAVSVVSTGATCGQELVAASGERQELAKEQEWMDRKWPRSERERGRRRECECTHNLNHNK